MIRLSSLQKYALSGILYVLLFPNFSLGFLAWFSLIPLIHASQRVTSRRKAFVGGFAAGLIAFGLSMTWVAQVIWFGWIFIACLEAVFMALFSLLIYEGRGIRQGWLQSIWIALSWTLCEFLRAEIPVFGIPWNLIGNSQTLWPEMLQAAGAVGVYGLGWGIVLVNACLTRIFSNVTMNAALSKNEKDSEISPLSKMLGHEVRVQVFLLLIFFAASLSYGGWVLKTSKSSGTVRLSVLQGNIAQELKWTPEARTKILEAYLKLSELVRAEEPDLIVWPEASFPGYFNRDVYTPDVLAKVAELGVPSLIGAPHLETQEIAYNSAYLLNEKGELVKRYDKQKLVPFGEYVPMQWMFGSLKRIAYALGVSDFVEGHESTVFDLKRVGAPFSTLICFEDVFPDLARVFVRNGAKFLLVITNDAWFGKSQAPYQHLQSSILRAVENGVPVIRAANTGVSAMINSQGKEIARVRGEKNQDIFAMGWKTQTVPLADQKTLFQSGGWLFPWAAGGIWTFFGLTLIRRRS